MKISAVVFGLVASVLGVTLSWTHALAGDEETRAEDLVNPDASQIKKDQVKMLNEAIQNNETESVRTLLKTGIAPPGMDTKLKEAVEANKTEAKNKLSMKDFESDYFSTGLYANFDLGARKRVNTASLDTNGIVRVEDGNSSQVGFYIQAHRFFYSNSPSSAHGVFIGIVPSPDGIISAAALGYVYGRRPKASFVSEKSSLNLGIGLSMSPSVNVLGDEINVNQPLPAGETQIRYKRTTIFGVIMSVTFGF